MRKLLGWDRYDTHEAVEAINNLYCNELRLWLNLYLPSVKLVKKVRVGSKVRRIYDGPRTPFERVKACPQADRERVARLEELRKSLDPFQLGRISAFLGRRRGGGSAPRHRGGQSGRGGPDRAGTPTSGPQTATTRPVTHGAASARSDPAARLRLHVGRRATARWLSFANIAYGQKLTLSTRRDLLLKILALRHQLGVLGHSDRRFRPSDRLL